MRMRITETSVSAWISASETYAWAHRSGASWPCSCCSSKRLFVQFDAYGIVDYTLNGRVDYELAGDEVAAISADHIVPALRKRGLADHPVASYLETFCEQV